MDREPKVISPKFFKPVQSAQDWKEIEERLSLVHPIRFEIDGYKVSFHMLKLKMKLVIILFIDEKYDIKSWEGTEIPEKFYQKKERFVFQKKLRDYIIKEFGKKKAKEEGIFEKRSYIQYYWTSFRSLRLHLSKTCKKIMVCKADLHRTIGDLFTEYKAGV